MGLFNKKVSLETQLEELAALGITQNDGVEDSDLFDYYSRDELESAPYKLLAEVLGMEIQREPWTPLADALWMCDFERVEGDGSYERVLVRLEQMTNAALGLESIQDHVDAFEHHVAWVSFEQAGRETKWDLRIDDDWLDPSVLIRYDQHLASSGSKLRLFMASNQDEYGQVAFLAALTPKSRKRFSKLTGVEMVPVD